MARVQSLGAAVRAGWKGALAGARVKRAAGLAAGLWAMLRTAVAVSNGALPLASLALLKRVVQPLVWLVELTQGMRMLARESSLA